jgi:hypothetical protein
VSALLELAERCERAAGPDRELDGAIDRLLNKRPKTGDYDANENCLWRVDGYSGLCTRSDGFARNSFCARDYTASLDAAMTLVPEGAGILLDRYWLREGEAWSAKVSTGGVPENRARQFYAQDAKSGSLALCAAALKARTASAGEAGTATTPKSGVVHEHAVGATSAETPNLNSPSQGEGE